MRDYARNPPSSSNDRDVLGHRRLFAVIGPSTNTIVQPDMEMMRPVGVTNAYRDIYVEDPIALSDKSFLAGAAKISDGLSEALRSALTCRPDYLVLGVSAISFVGGKRGSDAFVRDIKERTGLEISVGSAALVEALRAYGSIKRVAFLSPYYETANANVSRFLSDNGFDVVRDIAMRCTSWTNIARVNEATLIDALKELDGDDIDAIAQVGTNLSMVKLADAAEKWLGKPVIAINAATYWHALRTSGFIEKQAGLGRLFSDF